MNKQHNRMNKVDSRLSCFCMDFPIENQRKYDIMKC